MTADWLPNDSALRDGTLIEVRGSDGDIYIVQWETSIQRAEELGGDQLDYQGGFVSIDGWPIEITHWRPVQDGA